MLKHAVKSFMLLCLLLLPPPVCLSVCLSVCPSDNWKSCERILTKFLGAVGHDTGTKLLNFGDDPDHHPDPGVRSPKSGFTGLSEKLPTDFDEILWRAGVWLRDQLITFGWRSHHPHHYPDSGVRSGSRSGSGKNCHNSFMMAFGGGLCSLSTSSNCYQCFYVSLCCIQTRRKPGIDYIKVPNISGTQKLNGKHFQRIQVSPWKSRYCATVYNRSQISPLDYIFFISVY